MRIQYCLGNVIGDEFNYIKLEGNQLRLTHEISEATLYPRTNEHFLNAMGTLTGIPLAWLPVCVEDSVNV
jgi:hypothetical protein